MVPSGPVAPPTTWIEPGVGSLSYPLHGASVQSTTLNVVVALHAEEPVPLAGP